MTNRIHGCRNLETTCKDCGRVVCTVKMDDGWIFIDDQMPPEGEYILGCSGEGSPIFITRLHEGDWDTGANFKRPAYLRNEMFKTSASTVYWMPLPKPPIQ